MSETKAPLYRPFLLIKDTGVISFELIPEKKWKKDGLATLYPFIGGVDEILERSQISLHEGKPTRENIRWMWLDEMGHPRARPLNKIGTKLYLNCRATDHWIAGHVAIQHPRAIKLEEWRVALSGYTHLLEYAATPNCTVTVHPSKAGEQPIIVHTARAGA